MREKKYILPVIIISLLLIGIIALSIVLPAGYGIYIAFCFVAVIVLLVFRWKKLKKTRGNVALLILTCITFVFFVLSLYCNPYFGSTTTKLTSVESMSHPEQLLTKKQALRDADYAMRYLRKIHPATYGGLPQNVKAEWKKVRVEIASTEQISKVELNRKLESVFSLLGDAHTHISFSFNDEHYLKYVYAHNQAGDSFVSVNGIAREDLFYNNRQLFSTECDEYALTFLGRYIIMLEGLEYLGVEPIAGGYTYGIKHKDGTIEEKTYPVSDFVTYDEYRAYNGIENNSNGTYSFVRYEIDTEHDAGILTIDECDYNKTYRSTVKEFFEAVKATGVNNVIVDLRDNGGGSSLVANEFIRYLPVEKYKDFSSDLRMGFFYIPEKEGSIINRQYTENLFNGKVYVLTSVRSFSAAMDFAMYVKDNHLGLIVGQASGNRADSYGDVVCFRLPESKLYMQISWKKWYRIDTSTADAFIEPDLPCAAEDALDAAFNAIK